MDDELIDDVFEDDPKHYYQNTDTGLNFNEVNFLDEQTPSPTGKHPAFRNVDLKSSSGIDDDGWKSFKIEDDNGFDESLLHKVILLGDSGVGKTSFIVRYHTNEFKMASFAATVGIALTKFRQQTQHQQNNHAKAAQNNIESLSSATDSYRGDTGIDNDDAATDNCTGNMINRSGFSDSTTAAAGTSNSKQFTAALKVDKQQRRQVELYDVAGKVMLLGDSGVGKTCLLVRFRDGTFLSGSFISTVGIDFRTKIVQLDNARVKLQIWDTAGQEKFRSITHAYYRDAHALLLLYDVTNKTSFDNIRAWLVEIHEYAQDDVVILLLGNKADCPDRQVKREDGERLAREYNVTFMETSAKTGLNVDLAFSAVARKLKSRNMDVDEARFNVQDYVNEQTASKGPTCPPCNL